MLKLVSPGLKTIISLIINKINVIISSIQILNNQRTLTQKLTINIKINKVTIIDLSFEIINIKVLG